MGPCVAALVALCLIVVANGQVVTPIATQGLGYPAGVALDPAATIAYVVRESSMGGTRGSADD